MAQQDTGLGWSAKSEWILTVSDSAICSLGRSYIDLHHLPEIATATRDNILYYGIIGWHNTNGDSIYICIRDANAPTAAFIYYDGSEYQLGVVRESPSETTATSGYLHVASTTAVTDHYGTVSLARFLQDSITGLYYVQQPMSFGGWFPASVCAYGSEGTLPVYEDFNSGMADMVAVMTQYKKLYSGPAVASTASWITPEGTNLVSPVLISTVDRATIITADGTTPAADMETFSFLYQGARFYMSIVAGIFVEDVIINPIAPRAALEQFAAALPQKVFTLLADSSFSNIIVGEAPDPYGGDAEEAGGEGEDQEDDPVEEQTNPIPSVAGLGFCTIYVPSASELTQMASYLWSGNFDVSQVIKLFSNPLDSIIGLSAVPVDLVGTSEQIYLGGVPVTGVTMPRYTGRTAVTVDFGTATITERFGAYLDYDPYTQFSIYLPFVGYKTIKADDIMGKTISLMYDIDILSGGCVAYLRPAGGSVLYEWSGQCALQIPITGRNWDNVFQSAIRAATAIGAAVTAPASAPVLGGAVASAAVQAITTKPHVERSGAVNGITGYLGQLRPFIVRTIPEAYIADRQNTFIGYPAYINVDLATVMGYNEVDSIHLENVTATGAELEEIETILKGGVIF